MGIFSYTGSTEYEYMKYKSHRFHNICPHYFNEYKNQMEFIKTFFLHETNIFTRPSLAYAQILNMQHHMPYCNLNIKCMQFI